MTDTSPEVPVEDLFYVSPYDKGIALKLARLVAAGLDRSERDPRRYARELNRLAAGARRLGPAALGCIAAYLGGAAEGHLVGHGLLPMEDD